MRNIIKNLLTDNEKVSLTRLIAITAWLSFLIASAYLMITGKEWVHYEVFATFTAGGACVTRVADKYLSKKYNSVKDDEK